MATLTTANYLGYSNLQIAAESFIRDPETGALHAAGEDLVSALENGNYHTSKFTHIQAENFAAHWEVLDQCANTSTGFSGTLFRCIADDSSTGFKSGDLVMSFRSTEFIDDETRDSQATNDLEIKEHGWAFGQIDDMETWFQKLRANGTIPDGSTVNVTGYSLGGHLATAFNLLHYNTQHQEGFTLGNVVTFNGAGVGTINGGKTIGTVLQTFQNYLNSPDQIDAAITNSGLLHVVQNIRALLASSGVSAIDSAIQMLNSYLTSPYYSNSTGVPVTSSPSHQAEIVATALDNIKAIAIEAQRVPLLSSGSSSPGPTNVDVSQIAQAGFDYQMAMLLTSQDTSGTLPGNFVRTFMTGRRMGAFTLPNEYDVTADASPSAVSNSGIHYGNDIKVFIQDQPLKRGDIVSEVLAAIGTYSDIKLLENYYSKNDFGDTHSLILMVDSLSVQNALLQLMDPSQQAGTAATLDAIMRRASNDRAQVNDDQGNADGDSLFNIVNGLTKMLVPQGNQSFLTGTTTGNTWWEIDDYSDPTTGKTISGRMSLYKALDAIENNSDIYGQLKGHVQIALAPANGLNAKSDFGALLSLIYLTPFELKTTGADNVWETVQKKLYDQWNSDQKLSSASDSDDIANFSDLYLKDRAAMLGWINKRNAENFPTGAAMVNPGGDAWEFQDQDSKTTVDIGPSAPLTPGPIGTPSTPIVTQPADHFVIFGADGATDEIDGKGKVNHLFAGADSAQRLVAGSGDDYLEGGRGASNDTLVGGKGHDTLVAGNGVTTTLIAGTGGDTLIGGSGIDTFQFATGDGHDTIFHASSQDKLTINGNPLPNPKAVVVDGKQWTNDDKSITYTLFDAGNGTKDLYIAYGNNDSILIKNYTKGDLGLALGDATPATPAPTPAPSRTILGDLQPINFSTNGQVEYHRDDLGNLIVGDTAVPGQDDVLNGGGGDDLIDAGTGNNRISAQQGGNDTLRAGGGNDTLQAGNGNNVIAGGGGQDILIAGNGNNSVYVNDVIDIDSAIDAATAGSGTGQKGTLIGVGNGDNTIVGGAGNDFITAGSGHNLVILGTGNDTFAGGLNLTVSSSQWSATNYDYNAQGNYYPYDLILRFGRNFFDSASTGDYQPTGTYEGNFIADTMVGGGDTTIFGGSGSSLITLGNGANYVDVGTGNTTVWGGDRSDTIFGGSGKGALLGGGGDDYIDGESGSHVISGGSGNNTIFGGSGNDTIYAGGWISGGSFNLDGWATINGGNSYVEAGSGKTIVYGSGGNDTLVAGEGNDTIYAGDGNQTLIGGDGSDFLIGGNGTDVIDAGDGGTADAPTQIKAGKGNTTIYGGDGIDWIAGGSGKNLIYVGDGGTKSAPVIVRAGSGDTTVYGGNGVDQIYGGSGTNLLDAGDGGTADAPTVVQAGSGNTTIVSGAGFDQIIGGSGHTVYQLAGGGQAQLFNTNPGDVIQFGEGVTPDQLTITAQLYANQSSGLIIDDGNGGMVTIAGGLASGPSQYQFADGTVLSQVQLMQLANVSPQNFDGGNFDLTVSADQNASLVGRTGNDSIYGYGANDTLVGGVGTTLLSGGGSNTTYVASTSSHTTINNSTSTDTLVLGTGIDPVSLTAHSTTSDNVTTVTIQNASGGTIAVNGNAGSMLSKIQFADGSTTTLADLVAQSNGGVGKTVHADGSYVLTSNDGNGDITQTQYSAQGTKLSDTWQKADGSRGADNFGADGASSGFTQNSNGSVIAYTDDGSGDRTERHYNASGVETGDNWKQSDGSSGSDVFHTDGSSSGIEHHADGSYSTYTNDGQGHVTIVDYDAQGNKTGGSTTSGDGWVGAATSDDSGKTITAFYNADGIKTGDSWTKADGSHGSDVFNDDGTITGTSYNADGSYSTYEDNDDGQVMRQYYSWDGKLTGSSITETQGGHNSITSYLDADGNKVRETWVHADGSSGTDHISASDYIGEQNLMPGLVPGFSYNSHWGLPTWDDPSQAWGRIDGNSSSVSAEVDIANGYEGNGVPGDMPLLMDANLAYSTGSTVSIVGSFTVYDPLFKIEFDGLQYSDGSKMLEGAGINSSGNWHQDLPTQYAPTTHTPMTAFQSRAGGYGYSTFTDDGMGNGLMESYTGNGMMMDDIWWHNDGTQGMDVFFEDGSSKGFVADARGKVVSYTTDASGHTQREVHAGTYILTPPSPFVPPQTISLPSFSSLPTLGGGASGGTGSGYGGHYTYPDNNGGNYVVDYDLDGNGSITHYDSTGAVVGGSSAQTDPGYSAYTIVGNSQIGWSYDQNGIPTGSYTQDAQGRTTRYTYDAQGKVTGYSVAFADGQGNIRTDFYDASNIQTGFSTTLTNNDGSIETDTYNAIGFLTKSSVTVSDGQGNSIVSDYNGDGELVSTTATIVTGSNEKTITSYDAQGNPTGAVVTSTDNTGTIHTATYDANGNLTGSVVAAPDGKGNLIIGNYDAAGTLTGYVSLASDAKGDTVLTAYDPAENPLHRNTLASDGAHTDTDYQSDGSRVSTTWNADRTSQIAIDDGVGNQTTTVYGADGTKLRDSWQHADGSSGSDLFNADGTSSGSTLYADGSTSTYFSNGQGRTEVRHYAQDGTSTGSTITTTTALTTTTVNYDSNGNKTSDRWSNADGSSGADTFNTDGSHIGTVNDGRGRTTQVQFDAQGRKTQDSWTGWDGSSGADTFNADGSSSGTAFYTNGTTSTYTDDGHGNRLTQSFDFSGREISDSWTKSDGSHGSDTFNLDGSRSSETDYQDGSHTTYTDDGQGNTFNISYDKNGFKVGDSWAKPDGSHGTDTFNVNGSGQGATHYADGSSSTYVKDVFGDTLTTTYDAQGFKTSQTVTLADGSNGDGSSILWEGPDSNAGDKTITVLYDSQGNKIGDSWIKPDGSHGTDTFHADGSSASTTYRPDGSYSQSTDDGMSGVDTQYYSWSGKLLGANHTQTNGMHNAVTTYLDANGNKLGETWVHGDGTSGSDWLTSYNNLGALNGALHANGGIDWDSSSAFPAWGSAGLDVSIEQGYQTPQGYLYEEGDLELDSIPVIGSLYGRLANNLELVYQIRGWSSVSDDPDNSVLVEFRDRSIADANAPETDADQASGITFDLDAGPGATSANGVVIQAPYKEIIPCPNGTYEVVTADAFGNAQMIRYASDGRKMDDLWAHNDGTFGEDIFNADGSSVGEVMNWQGVTTYADDGHGHVTVAKNAGLFSSWSESPYGSVFAPFGSVYSGPNVPWQPASTSSIATPPAPPAPPAPASHHLFLFPAPSGSGDVPSTGYRYHSGFTQTWTNADGSSGYLVTYSNQGGMTITPFGDTGSSPSNSGASLDTDPGYALYTMVDGDRYGWNYDVSGIAQSRYRTDSQGNTTTYTYDSFGHATGYSTTASDADGNVTVRNYDIAGHLTGYSQAITTASNRVDTTFYDANGHVVSTRTTVSDDQGDSTTSSFDGHGNLVSRSTTVITGDHEETVTNYDANGNPTGAMVTDTGADGVITTSTYDGSGTLTGFVVATPDNQGSVTTASYDASGALTGYVVFNTQQGSMTLTGYDASGAIQRQEALNNDGTETSAVYHNDGSGAVTTFHTDGSQSIMTADGTGNILTTNYDASGFAFADTWQHADGSSGSDTFQPDGSATGSASYPDGSTSTYTRTPDGKITTSHYEADGMLTGITIKTDIGGTVTIANYGTDGAELNDTWAKTDGSYGNDVYQADGSHSETANNGHGMSTATQYDAAGNKVSDSWAQPDGSHGTDIFNADGGHTSMVVNPDGTSTQIVDDGHGDIMTTQYDANGVKRTDTWAHADGTQGNDLFRDDGSSYGTWSSPDGTHGIALDDGQGNTTATTYNANGQDIADRWTYPDGSWFSDTNSYDATGFNTGDTWAQSDGSHGTDTFYTDGSYASTTYAPDGSYRTYAGDSHGDTWQASDGSSGTDTFNTDGSSSDTWQHADGSHGNDAFNTDGSSSGTAINADGSYSTYTNDGQGNWMQLLFNANGVEIGDVWTKADGTSGSDTFVVTNQPPTVAHVIADQNTDELNAFRFTIPAGTFADDGGNAALTYQVTQVDGTPLPSWLTFDAQTATLSGVPGDADVGALQLQVIATDHGGLTVATTFNLTVNHVNETPVPGAAIADQVTDEAKPYTFIIPANAFTDPNTGDVLAYSVTLSGGQSLPAWLAFDPHTHTLSGTPADADTGNLAIQVTATDPSGLTATTSFNLTINNINEAPVVAGSIGNQTTDEAKLFSFTLPSGTFTDPDAGDTLAYQVTLANGDPLPSWLQFDSKTNTLFGTPGDADTGLLSLKVTASDAGGLSAGTAFEVMVNNVNEAPVVGSGIADQTTDEAKPFVFAIPSSAFRDPDAGDTLSYTISQADGSALPSWLSFDPKSNTLSGTPGDADTGILAIKVTATDTGGLSASTAFQLTINNVNEAPVVVSPIADQVTDEAKPFSFTLPLSAFADPDAGDALAYSVTLADGKPLPAWLTFDSRSNTLSGTPRDADTGILSLKINATDSGGLMASTGFNLTINNVNEAPLISNPIVDQQTDEAKLFTFAVPANTFVDPDAGDALSLRATLSNGDLLPAWLAFDPKTATFSGTPGDADTGTLGIKVTATDTGGLSSDALFSLTINDVNEAPVVSHVIADQSTDEAKPFTFVIPAGTFADPDRSDVLTYRVTLADGKPLPAWLGFDPKTNTLSGTPADADTGTLAIKVAATDSGSLTAETTFELVVNNINEAPVAGNAIADQTTDEAKPFSFVIPGGAFRDPDAGDILAYQVSLADGTPLPAWLSFDAKTNTLSGTPKDADTGVLALKVTATDGGGLSASTAFQLTVNNVNEAPVVSNPLADQATNELSAFSFAIPAGTFTDPDAGDTLAYAVTRPDGSALPSWLTFDGKTGILSGTPPDSDVGTLTLKVTATDPSGLQAATNFGLTVNAVDTLYTSVSTVLPAHIHNLTGTGTADLTLTGNALNNVITANSGNDTLVAGSGMATLIGGAGNDTFVINNNADVIQAQAGGINTIQTSVSYTAPANVQNLTGTGSANLTLTGNSLNNVITANAGSDTLIGGLGNDTLVGAGGAATTYVYRAGDGLDTITHASGHDIAQFGSGLNLDNMVARVVTMNGQQIAQLRVLDAQGEEQPNQGLNFAVTIDAHGHIVSPIQSFILANGTRLTFNDLLIEQVTTNGTNQSDTLTGSRNDDIMYGGNGNDTLYGGAGSDTLDGGNGNDYLNGGADNDALFGGNGNDILQGGRGNDSLDGGNGNDLLDAGDGSDSVTAGNGNDWIAGGKGNDTLDGGSGQNVFAFDRGDGSDTIVNSLYGNDTLSLGGIRYADLSLSKSGNDLIVNMGQGDSIDLKDWYAGSSHHGIGKLQVITAMGDYDPNSADKTKNRQIEQFDFGKLVQAFDAARAANPATGQWAVAGRLGSAYLSGSNTAAIGGDLSYQYGKSGTLSGMTVYAMETVMQDGQFGNGSQAVHAANTTSAVKVLVLPGAPSGGAARQDGAMVTVSPGTKATTQSPSMTKGTMSAWDVMNALLNQHLSMEQGTIAGFGAGLGDVALNGTVTPIMALQASPFNKPNSTPWSGTRPDQLHL